MNKNIVIASISMVTCSKYIKLGSGVECCLGIDELCRCLLFDRWAEIRCSSTGEWTFFVRLTQVEKPTLGWLCSTNTFAYIPTHTFTLHTNTNTDGLHTNTALYLYIDLARICIYVHQYIFYTYFIKTLLFNIGLRWIYPTNAQIQLCIYGRVSAWERN